MYTNMLKIYKDKNFLMLLSLLIIQQGLGSCSMIFLSQISSLLENNNLEIITPLILFFLFLVLPYIPGGISLSFLKMWENSLLEKFVWNFVNENSNKPHLFPEKELQEKKVSTLNKEIPSYASYITGFSYDIFSCIFNMALNLILIAIVLDVRFLWVLAVSLFFVALIMRFSAKIISNREEKNQDSRLQFTKHLINFWDSNILGNRIARRNWSKEFESDFKQYKKTSSAVENIRQVVSISIALFTFLPMVAISLYIVKESSNDLGKIILLVGTIPRLFSVLANTHHFLSLLASIPMYKQMYEGIVNYTLDSLKPNFEGRIKMSQLEVMVKNIVMDSSQAIEKINNCAHGRFTIRGENGTGKSTLLLRLKSCLGKKSFYLPGKDSQYYNQKYKGSTGQLIKSKLLEVSKEKFQYLLLDEWDANLDRKNTLQLDEYIDELAKSICVVEVRH